MKQVFSQNIWTVLGLICCGIFQPDEVLAQSDTLRGLPQVTIRETRGVQWGYSGWNADSLPAGTGLTLADRLLWEAPVDIRINAPDALSTISARGAGPSRTAVIWEGLNLQSPMNGVVDVALIPFWPDDQVEMKYGGQSAQFSSGAMGGSLQINSTALPDSADWYASLGCGAGSFGNFNGQAALGFGGEKFRTKFRSAWYEAENNFPFRNTAVLGQPEVKQVNNHAERFDIQNFSELKINRDNELKTAVWFQQAFREIPPSMTEAPSNSWQKDHSFRGVGTWTRRNGNNSQWQHKLAYLHEYIAFNLVGDIDTSRSNIIQSSSEYVRIIKDKLTLRANLNGWLQTAQADGYSDTTSWFHQKRLAGVVGAEYQLKHLQLHARLRQEWAEGLGSPFTWAAGARWYIPRHIYLHFHFSRNFNLPTFNDRFWQTLGNPALKPESGYSAETGIRWENKFATAEGTLFHLLLDDWILWQPGADGLFRPNNLRQVWSRGATLSSSIKANFWRSRWKLKGRYQFVRATNTAVYAGNTTALHKLLPYTPQHTGSVGLSWSRGAFQASYLHQWIGSRFVTADNSSQLNGFQTGNFLLQFNFQNRRHQVQINARIENCWDSAYQVIAYRPMPGRSWHLGLNWKFN